MLRRLPVQLLAISFCLVASSKAELNFNRDIRPILSEYCFACHGPDKNARKADLRLDDVTSATAERDGFRAIVAGDVKASDAIRRILSDDPEEVMPPRK